MVYTESCKQKGSIREIDEGESEDSIQIFDEDGVSMRGPDIPSLSFAEAMEAARIQEAKADSDSVNIIESDEWTPFSPDLTTDEVRRWAEDGCLFCAELISSEGVEESSGNSTMVYWMTNEPYEKMGIMVLFASRQEDGSVSDAWGCFNLLTFPGGVASQVIPRHPINTDPASEQSFKLVRGWLQTCQSSHEGCPKVTSKFMPTRVIEIVGDGEDGMQLRLLETRGLIVQYVALSYCWGGEQELKTTAAVLPRFKESLPAFAKLPATIQDAVRVTHELGLRHLFVDAFCIVQDDGDDMQQQIAQMPAIYSEAVVTVIASRAASVADGFLQKRPSSLPDTDEERYEAAFQLPMRCAGGDLDSVVLLRLAYKGLTTDPIYTRAWTMQEQLLATRIIAYNHNHTRWGCWSAHTPTDGWIQAGGGDDFVQAWEPAVFRAPSLSSGPPVRPDVETVRYGWRRLVMQYTSRSLSFPGDKLPAIAAAAVRVGEALRQDDYVAGLWKSSLIHDLFWKTVQTTRQVRPREFRAPSWSWAAVDGEIDYFARIVDLKSATVEVLDCRVEPAHQMLPYGAVKGGCLVVRGRLRRVVLQLEATDRNFFHATEPDREGLEAMLPVSFDAIEPEFANTAGDSIDVALLELHDESSGEPVSLVLRDLGNDTFCRLGVSFRSAMVRFQIGDSVDDGRELARSHLDWVKGFEKCVPTTITIV
ncbi:tol-like protein [Grosmannia clavigera kw1407]|uniref:Tol-like protein n=1 Tax=Grosmannia clavigera (strain kw1407 / UAMH 11150) TaxID=655863 RepID=F0XMS4_GROCL|nr:tol-like protein [Grosmannia clavigera kw1407]EFX01376.1 tol-like protein [Grosmannia clavigera kw1407]